MSTDHTAISMSHQISESRLRALIAQWRESAVWESEHGNHHRASDLDQCADELEAALAEGADPFELRCQYCGRETQQRTMGLCEGCVRKIVRWSATVPPKPSQDQCRHEFRIPAWRRHEIVDHHCWKCGMLQSEALASSPHQTPESR